MGRCEPIRWMTLCALLACAAPTCAAAAPPSAPPADVGAYLQAGAALKAALSGRHGLAHESLPGSIAGLEVRPDRKKPFDAARNRHRLYDDGQAYAAGDSFVVTTLVVTRREIDVILGYGGYDPARLAGGPPSSNPQQQALEWQIRVTAAKEGIPTGDNRTIWYENLTDEARAARVRQLESQRGAAIKAGEDAEASNLMLARHKLAGVAGSRVRLLFDRDIPLADLSERRVRELLAPYVTLAD